MTLTVWNRRKFILSMKEWGNLKKMADKYNIDYYLAQKVWDKSTYSRLYQINWLWYRRCNTCNNQKIAHKGNFWYKVNINKVTSENEHKCFNSICKVCRNLKARNERKINWDEVRKKETAYQRKYRLDPEYREKWRLNCAKYRIKNREKYLQWQKDYRKRKQEKETILLLKKKREWVNFAKTVKN